MRGSTIGEGGETRFHPRGGHQNNPFRGWDYMIPYMAGKLAPNSSRLTRGIVKRVPGRDYFRAIPSQTGTNMLHPRPPLIVELVNIRTRYMLENSQQRSRQAQASIRYASKFPTKVRTSSSEQTLRDRFFNSGRTGFPSYNVLARESYSPSDQLSNNCRTG